MFRKYEKTFRINTPNIKVPGKFFLSHTDVQRLLTGHIIIEEKIDGANVGIIGGRKNKEFRLQKRGSLVDLSEHPQFGRFKAWSYDNYENLMQIKWPMIIYGEFMWATHHIYYNQLPDWFVCFDIWDGEKFLGWGKRAVICDKLKLAMVPRLCEGYIKSVSELDEFVDGPSEYNPDVPREGIVIKNYRKQMHAKIVRPNFIKEINEDGQNWARRWNPRKVNKLGPR